MSEESGMTTEDHAAQCLGNLGQSAMERLRELWKNGKVGDDAYATAILFTSEPGAFPLLEEATKSTNEQICEYGLKALGRYKANAKAASLLLPFVESPNERFAAAAHESLVDIGHKDTIRGISKEKYPKRPKCWINI